MFNPSKDLFLPHTRPHHKLGPKSGDWERAQMRIMSQPPAQSHVLQFLQQKFLPRVHCQRVAYQGCLSCLRIVGRNVREVAQKCQESNQQVQSSLHESSVIWVRCGHGVGSYQKAPVQVLQVPRLQVVVSKMQGNIP